MTFCLLAILPASAAEKVVITKIEATRVRGLDYLDIHSTGNLNPEGLLLENKIVLDFPGASIAKDVKVIKPARSGRIKDIRAKTDKPQIVIDLKKSVDYEVVNVFGKNKSVVEISDRLDYADRLMAAWEKANLKQTAPKLEPKEYKAATKKDLPLHGKTVVIDPGHGGLDLGSVSVNNISEKRLTLATAKKVAHLLNAAGAKVYLTRSTDRTVGIRDIVDFANRTKADIFISIHYNYSSLPNVGGTETFYYNRQSRDLALALHSALVHGIRRRDRGLRRMMYFTIHHTDMPAALVEPLYISNAKEAQLAAQPGFQARIARDIARGVKNYFRSKVR
ncbi:N-acetylmuramoyl-L-alanine amidase [Candidatus Margulisiibacteriota bacterium]